MSVRRSSNPRSESRNAFQEDLAKLSACLIVVRGTPALWKVWQNECNRDCSDNARPPEEKMFHSRNRLAWKWMCRRECRFVDKCKDICWQKTNLLTKKIFWHNLLTKTKSADSKNLLTKSADKNKICWQETSPDKICLRKENLLVIKNSWRIEYIQQGICDKNVCHQAVVLPPQKSIMFKKRLIGEICWQNRLTKRRLLT